jgi:succinate dehydrogenase/fumarate reductase cytochrome b subunit
MADVPGLARRFFVGATRALPFWLLGYLVLHALEQAAVRTGRDALLAQLASTAHARLEVLCVLVPAALYLGARPRLLRGPWPQGLTAVHMISGVLAAALLALHLAQVWWPRVRTSAPSAAYVAMLETTSTPAGAALQLLFVTASLLHLGVAVVPGLQGLGLSLRHASGVAVALCTALWIWLVNLLSAYVAGAPLL